MWRKKKFELYSKKKICNCSHDSWVHSADTDMCQFPGCGCSRYRAQTKYKNVKSKLKGIVKDSKFEAKVGFDLDIQKRAGLIKEIIPQYPIELRVNGVKVTTYRADYFVTYADGTQEIIEVKGFFTDYAKLKWKLFTAIYENEHPEIKITMIRK